MSENQAVVQEPRVLVEAKNLHVQRKGLALLNNVSLSVEQGARIAIIGPRQSGKSTLLECLAGALRPSQGELRIQGKVTRVRQKPALVGCKTVLENILHGKLHRAGLFSSSRVGSERERITELAALAGLDKKLDLLVSELSDLERFKTAIIRATLQNADLILVDEFSEEIDLKEYRGLLNLIGTLNNTPTTSIVAVVPDYELASEFSDHLLAFEKGVLLYDTSSESPWFESAADVVAEGLNLGRVVNDANDSKSSSNFLAMLPLSLLGVIGAFSLYFFLAPQAEGSMRNTLGVGLFETIAFAAVVAPISFFFAWILNSFVAQTRSKFFRFYLFPQFYRLRTIPAVLWAFLLLGAFGANYTTGVIALFISSFFYLFSELYYAARQANQSSALELRELGATKRQQYLLAIWPYTKKRSRKAFVKSFTRTLTEALLVGLCGCGGLGSVFLLSLQKQDHTLTLLASLCCFAIYFLSLAIREQSLRSRPSIS